MLCPAYDDGRCRSCTLLALPYDEQLAGKAARARDLLAPFGAIAWADPVASAAAGYRNKAKLVVGGTAGAPTLGILDADHRGVDLQDCLLYEPRLAAAFPALADFVGRAALTPYSVPERTGELKHLLVTVSPDGELMVRFVLRSTEALARIRKHLPALAADLPSLAVASVNVLPQHAALLEGEREIPLTAAEALRMTLGGIDLWLRPQGFFQTNTAVAAALYREATSWVSDEPASSLWDLYCGVGGFALHAAAAGAATHVLGVETSEAAVAGARASAAAAGVDAQFVAGDATAFAVSGGSPGSSSGRSSSASTPPGGSSSGPSSSVAPAPSSVSSAFALAPSGGSSSDLSSTLSVGSSSDRSWSESRSPSAASAPSDGSSSAGPPDVVIVNPPRRGIGPVLAGWLESSGVPRVLYSSCHVESLARDLAAMPSLRPVRARLLDMFPQTVHGEVLVELVRA